MPKQVADSPARNPVGGGARLRPYQRELPKRISELRAGLLSSCLVVLAGSPSGVVSGFDVGEVEAAGAVEGVLGGADGVAVGEDGVLVAVAAGEVDREAPQVG